MWLVQLLLLFVVYSLGPGLWVVRRLRLGPREKLVAAVAASYVLVYLASFAIYLARLDPRWHVGVALLSLGSLFVLRRDLVRLLRHRSVRRLLIAFALLAAWTLLLVSIIRHYGGGTWGGDWIEQYQRTLFFLHHRPTDTLMMGKFPLPARPPLMNLVAASFMAQAGPSYEVFQVVYALLNSLVLLPCCLLAGDLVRRPGRRLPYLLLLILAANPMASQNLSYAWTKLFTAFYVILAVHLYLCGWRKNSPLLLAAAFFSVSAGFLVHHSAGPYALVLGLHYIAVVFWRRGRSWAQRFAEAAGIGIVSLLLLLTWFGWAAHVYGARTTFGANSTVSDSAVMTPAQNAANVGRNIANTLVPRVLQWPGIMSIEELRQSSPAGRVRDFTFLIYQVSLTFALGSAGAVALGALLWKLLPRPGRLAERRFLLAFVVVVFFVGVAVYGGVDRFGVAHVCLQSLALIGLTFLAAGYRHLPATVRVALCAGLLLDVVLGVFLQVTLENRDFVLIQRPDGTPAIWAEESLAQAPQFNWATKIAPELLVNKDGRGDTEPLLNATLPFFGDRFTGMLAAQQLLLVALLGAIAWLALKPDSTRAPQSATTRGARSEARRTQRTRGAQPRRQRSGR